MKAKSNMKRILFVFAAMLLLCACENERDNRYSVFRKEYRTDFAYNVDELDGETYKSQNWFQFDYGYEKNGNGHVASGAVTYRASDNEWVGALENVYEEPITYRQHGQIVVTEYKGHKDTIISYGDSVKIWNTMYYYYGPSEP